MPKVGDLLLDPYYEGRLIPDISLWAYWMVNYEKRVL